MYDIPLDFLVSPITKTPLEPVDQQTLKDAEGTLFRRSRASGCWNFIPERSPLYSDAEWTTFRRLIDNFVVSYMNAPEVNVSYDVRPDAMAFGEFCAYRGRVLDIGCGPHKVPSYIGHRRNPAAEYYGIDVLEGEHPKGLQFAQAMGEHLPFKDDLFDVTISGTSLLHYVNVAAGIREALRVTSPTGHLCIWLGVKSQAAPPPKESPEWYKQLEVPEGAANPFHYRRYAAAELEDVIRTLDAQVIGKETLRVDEWRENVFLKVRK